MAQSLGLLDGVATEYLIIQATADTLGGFGPHIVIEDIVWQACASIKHHKRGVQGGGRKDKIMIKNDENINNITINRLFPGVSRGTRSHERGICEAQKHAKRRHGKG